MTFRVRAAKKLAGMPDSSMTFAQVFQRKL
jgi:hypothetical protein